MWLNLSPPFFTPMVISRAEYLRTLNIVFQLDNAHLYIILCNTSRVLSNHTRSYELLLLIVFDF